MWVMIKGIIAKGISKSETARMLGLDRKTVSKYLKLKEIPKYVREKGVKSKLDSFKPYIATRLSEYNLTAQKIYEEIVKQGFDGKYGIVHKHVSSIKAEYKSKAVLRFETLPGEQAQVDWGYFGSIFDKDERREIKLYCFVMVLGFSRMKYIEFCTDMKVETFLKAHNNAFLYFGGHTKEILYDNLKAVVIKRALRAKDSEFNKKFMDFAGFYGFQPILARPYKPTTKGKVENTIKFIRSSFFAGEEFSGLKDINERALEWLKIKNGTQHSFTHCVPSEQLKQELLIPVTIEKLYDTSIIKYRKVLTTSYISYRGNYYSVPYVYVDKEISIKENSNREIQMFYRNKEIAKHKINIEEKQIYITHQDHFKGLKEIRYGKMKPKIKVKNKEPKSEVIILKKHLLQHEVEIRELSSYEIGAAL
jgi:transposase